MAFWSLDESKETYKILFKLDGLQGDVASPTHARESILNVALGCALMCRGSVQLVAHIRDQRLGLWEAMAEENAEQARLCKTADYAEGFRAFQERREPKSTGGKLPLPTADL